MIGLQVCEHDYEEFKVEGSDRVTEVCKHCGNSRATNEYAERIAHRDRLANLANRRPYQPFPAALNRASSLSSLLESLRRPAIFEFTIEDVSPETAPPEEPEELSEPPKVTKVELPEQVKQALESLEYSKQNAHTVLMAEVLRNYEILENYVRSLGEE